MKKLLSRRVVVCACAVLAVLFLVRPSASHLQDRVARSISAALGRNVEISSLHIRFLPRPGFDIENLTIRDDARFGAEPLVRAPQVTVALQVGALLRGHIQIAALSFDDASFNLTRNSAGDWNLADVLQRTSSITVAPTAAGRRTATKAFPYIQASGARVNLKIGNEKTHFALTDARLALWQESENTWGVRVEAQPIRTDANLTDTGVFVLNGTWQRSPQLRTTPLQLSFTWKRAQLGQVTKLISGVDREWRGAIAISGQLAGTPENLKIATEASISDFRGANVMADGNLRLAARCSAEYSTATGDVADLDCSAPSGDGSLELRGSLTKGTASPSPFSGYDLRLSAAAVPVQSVLTLLRHTNANLAGSLSASGQTNASVHVARAGSGPAQIEGSGELENVRLVSASNGELAIGTVPFEVTQGVPQEESSRQLRAAKRVSKPASEEPQIDFGPFDLNLSKAAAPVQVHGYVSRSGYQGSIHGDARIKQLLQGARIVGIPTPAVAADGNSTVDLTVAGGWDLARPRTTGMAQLRSVTAQVRGLNGPIGISKANLILKNDELRVSDLTATAADTTWHGSLRIPRPCPTPSDCELEVNLRTAELSAAALNQSLNPALQKKSWYKFLQLGSGQPQYLLQARATGVVTIERLVLGHAACSHFSAGLRLSDGRISLSQVNGEVLGGTVSGDWQANFTADPPAYKGSGELQSVSLTEIAELMHDGWVDGSADAKYQFTATGRSLRELLDSADLSTDFSISDSIFPHIVLSKDSGPLRAQDFSGSAQLHDGEIAFTGAKLDTARGVYTVSGTASLDGALNFRITGEGLPGYLVSGTILETRVTASPTTAAALKP